MTTAGPGFGAPSGAPIIGDLVHYESTALVIDDGLEIDEWLFVARALGAMTRGHQWWVGDVLVYGERYGEDVFSQAAEELGLEPHTLTNWRWVASAVKPSRRRDDLTWSHHAEVARLGPKAQRDTLARAAKLDWTVRQLRDHVALTYPQSHPELFGDDSGEPSGRAEVDIQKRLEELERKLDGAMPTDYYSRIDLADVRWLLDLAKRLTRKATR
jgi:hypothetical protein